MLYIMNSLITPFRDQEAVFRIKRISLSDARNIIFQNKQFVSAIGHEATAQLMSILLQTNIPVNRVQIYFNSGDEAIVVVLKSRLPEGVILRTVEEIERIGYELFHVQRIS